MEDSIDFIRSCAWSFLRETALSPRAYYNDVVQEATVAYLSWKRRLDSGECPKDWKNFARSAVRYHLFKRFMDFTGANKYGRIIPVGLLIAPDDKPYNDIAEIVSIRDWLSKLEPDERKMVRLLCKGEKQSAIESRIHLTHGTYYRKRKHIQDSYRDYFGDAG